MLSLQEIQKYYAMHFENKVFRYRLKGGQIIDLRFYAQSFCHLLGIQHIMHHDRNFTGLRGYQKIACGDMTLSSLRQRDARQYQRMKRRIMTFVKVHDALCQGDIYKFYLMRQPRSKIRADFILYWMDDDSKLYHNLFLAKEKSLLQERKSDHAYSALSYVVLTEKDDYRMYIDHQEYKEILAFEVLPLPDDNCAIPQADQLAHDLKDVRAGRHLSRPYKDTKELFRGLEI